VQPEDGVELRAPGMGQIAEEHVSGRAEPHLPDCPN